MTASGEREVVKRFLFAFVLVCCGAFAAFALDEQYLVLPPGGSAATTKSVTERWQAMLELYHDQLYNVQPVPYQKLWEKWHGEIPEIGLYDLGIAEELGQEFNADFVVLAEWFVDEGGMERVRVQRFDPWSGDLVGPCEGVVPGEAVQKMEADRWLFDDTSIHRPESLVEAKMVGGINAVEDYIEQTETYPDEARMALMKATVKARVHVSPQGIPVEVTLLSVTPKEWDFEQPIQKALWDMRWNPATVAGNTVHFRWEKEFTILPMPSILRKMTKH